MESRSVLLTVLLFAYVVTSLPPVNALTDADVMNDLKGNLTFPAGSPLFQQWNESAADPCQWEQVVCDGFDQRVTKIQIGNQSLGGHLPASLRNLTFLKIFEVHDNHLDGQLPDLSGLDSLQRIFLNGNRFTSIPPGFFSGMTSLVTVSLDYNPFAPWQIPESLKDSSNLISFSAVNCSISGQLPDIFSTENFPNLENLHLSYNNLSGQLPASFSGSSLHTLWLNNQNPDHPLSGTLDVLQNMTQLTQVWLHGNNISGQIPDLSGLISLQEFKANNNLLTGTVPATIMTNISSLQVVNLANNFLQGPIPAFSEKVNVDNMDKTNSFCGKVCDSKVNTLLDIAKDASYPLRLAENWKGNDPCAGAGAGVPWTGITCNSEGNITVVNLKNMGLTGEISSAISSLTTLRTLDMANNSLTGSIPENLTNLNQLTLMDLSYNQLCGNVPKFNTTVEVNTVGNANIGKDCPPPSPPTP